MALTPVDVANCWLVLMAAIFGFVIVALIACGLWLAPWPVTAILVFSVVTVWALDRSRFG